MIIEKSPIKDKWWTVPQSDDGIRKILYLDFESGQEEIAKKMKEIVSPCMERVSNKAHREKCFQNFIIEDLKNKGIKCTDEKGQKKILGLLEKARNSGTPDRPVDLVVFDTYSAAVGAENSKTWEKFESLIDQIQSQGISVLVIHHSNADGSSRGFANKEDKYYCEIELYREDNQNGTLEDPFWIKINKHRGNSIPEDGKSFQVCYDGKSWKTHNPPIDAIEEFGKIVSRYKSQDFYRDAIIKMLGIGKSTYHKRMEEYIELKKK